MKFDRKIHHRRSIRLQGYDYSRLGLYFVTIVTHGRESLFGEIENGEMCLSKAGQIVWDAWNSLPTRYPDIALGTAVVMPNHFHGIIAIHVGAIHELPRPQTRAERRRMTLPLVVGYFKMNSATRINLLLGSPGIPVWQRNYYDHIIRNDEEHNRIHLYIEANVNNWQTDEENPRCEFPLR